MCLFCNIVERRIPAKILYEDALALAFADIAPKAPTHVLVIPKKHISSLVEATPEDAALLGHLLVCASAVAREAGVASSGFRTVINNGGDAGQSVDHLHVHVLGGRALAWPPG
jgi:histidine triad (HIT) family protein